MAATEPVRAFTTEPYAYGEARRLATELGVSEPVAVMLVRRGYGAVEDARAFLEASDEHDPFAFDSMDEITERLLARVAAGRRITVHGDYDVDGVCSTAILVATLRELGADCDWYIPDRKADGYGLTDASVASLAGRGTDLILTADCGVTCAAEVASARAAGIEVIVTDHHAPGEALPDCPILHPRLCGYPFAELCAAGVTHKLSLALRRRAGRAEEPAELELVALATVADLVPLVGENRRLVRAGIAQARRTTRPGMRALIAVSGTDPATLDESAFGFRLAPRINAAGRLYRADAGVELLLTDDNERAAAIADELDRANGERRAVEAEIAAAAESARAALPAEQTDAPALVLAGAGWHPGVVGIVASRLVERYWRPVVVIGLEGDRGRGSARSIPGFDLVAALEACSSHLGRFGGHSAAAGLDIAAIEVEAFRDAFLAVAARELDPSKLTRTERVDAIVGVGGEGIGIDLAEELERLGPFGSGNPGPRLLMPAARIGDVRPMGSEGQHSRFDVYSGSGRAIGVAFNANGELSGGEDERSDLSIRLEVDRWNGAVQPRVVLRDLYALPDPPPDEGGKRCPSCAGAGGRRWWERVELERVASLRTWPAGELAEAVATARTAPAREIVERRGGAAVAALAELISSGERVLALCADASRRSELAERAADPRRFGAPPPVVACSRCDSDAVRAALGDGSPAGLALADWDALRHDPAAPRRFEHIVLVDPPPFEWVRTLAAAGRANGGSSPPWAAGFLHLAWGRPEVELALRVLDREWLIRASVADIYHALHDDGGVAAGDRAVGILAGASRHPRSPELAGRCLRVMGEAGIAEWNGDLAAPELRVLSSVQTRLEASEAYRAYVARHEEGKRYLTSRQR